MKNLACRLVVITLVCAFYHNAMAQFSTTLTSVSDAAKRPLDFWFSPLENNLSDSGKQYFVELTAPEPTIAYIEVNGFPTVSITIDSAYRPKRYLLPLSWEVKTSGVVENKAIHVWSDEVPLTVTLLSYSPASTDATAILPTLKLDTNYVVAAYSGIPNAPSEFNVTALADNTLVTITPTADIHITGYIPTAQYYPGKTFTVQLNSGQCIQFQTPLSNEGDLTGSVIHSNHPVSVIGGSTCAGAYCGHICEMTSPISSWDTIYYTVNPSQNASDRFLMIASKDNQFITLTGGTTRRFGPFTKYGFQWDDGTDATRPAAKWQSDAPFYLVQYSSFDFGHGYPSSQMTMTNVVPPRDYSNQVVALIPPSPDPSQNQIYIIAHTDDSVALDGNRLTYKLPTPFDFSWYPGRNYDGGSHIVKSKHGTGVLVFGYGQNSGYTFAPIANIPPPSDSVAPRIITDITTSNAISFTATDVPTGNSGIFDVKVTDNNLRFLPDPTFVNGTRADSIHFSFTVIDTTKDASAYVRVIDKSGNSSLLSVLFKTSFVSAPRRIQSISAVTPRIPVGTSTPDSLYVQSLTAKDTVTLQSIQIDSAQYFAIDLSKISFPIKLLPLQNVYVPLTFHALISGNVFSKVRVFTDRGKEDSVYIYGTGLVESAVNFSNSNPTQERLTILGIHPNPVSTATTIDFATCAQGRVTVELFDEAGNRIFNLLNAQLDAGTHSVPVDVQTLPAGTYIYRLEIFGEVRTGKITVRR